MTKDELTGLPVPPSAPRPAPFKALVADDDPRWRALVGEIVQDAGGTVTAAEGPVTELEGYDLAVLDLALDPADPDDLDGLEMIARLAQTRTPCIVVSGLPEGEWPAGLLDQPHVAGVVPKGSFRRETLVELLQLALGRPAAIGRTRVLIVEDDERWRSLYAEVLGEAGYSLQFAVSYGEARGWLGRAAFGLTVVDLHLISSAAPDENRDGFWLLRAARQRGVPAIVVSALGAPEDIDRAYDEYGVYAFVEKEAFDRGSFRRTVEAAIRAGVEPGPAAPGRVPVAPVSGAASEAGVPKLAAPALDDLTEREHEVLDLLTQGCTNRQIAETLAISANTVKKHVDHILQKLGVSNRSAAVAVALRGEAAANDPDR